MKQIISIAICLVFFASLTSCDKDSKGKLDPSAKVYISPAAGVALQSGSRAQGQLTARQVVEQAQGINNAQWEMNLGDWNRDLVNNRFNVGASWVVDQRGRLEPTVIEARDYLFITLNEKNLPKDTIAYIPNALMADVEPKIKAAYAAENYAECYRLLQDGFRFTPITGAEYLVLQAKGEN